MKTEIIKDGRTLRKLAKQFNFEYCHIYKYLTVYPENFPTINRAGIANKTDKHNYAIQFHAGCFYPFLYKIVKGE